MTAALPTDTKVLAGAFAASSLFHLIKPEVFTPIIPAPLRGRDRELVIVSGLAELACAVGLAVERTRPLAGLASAALLVAVFPANVQMSLDAAASARRRPSAGRVGLLAVTLARLPLQWPMIRAALRAR